MIPGEPPAAKWKVCFAAVKHTDTVPRHLTLLISADNFISASVIARDRLFSVLDAYKLITAKGTIANLYTLAFIEQVQ